MPAGIRATVEFDSGDVCPVVDISTAADAPVDAMTANVCPDGTTGSVTEFSMEADRDPDGRIEPIFSHGSGCRYRLPHDGEVACPCECLGSFGCPVDSYTVRDGTLTLVFHAADYDQLRDVVGELRDRFPGADVKRFVRSPGGQRPSDTAFVDRSKLTDRQRETLETAFEMGYFERPREANATEVAEELSVSQSTVSEHLAAGLTKVLGDVLEEE